MGRTVAVSSHLRLRQAIERPVSGESTVGREPEHTTRASLLQRVRDPQNKEGWREFFQIYQPLLYRYARVRGLSREDADELAQQCMTLLIERMPRFEYSQGKGGFKHWLRKMINNKINDFYKKRKVPLAESADFRRPQERETTLEEIWEREWEKKHLQYFLKQIRDEVAPNTYQAFEYHVICDWPVERVVETLGVTPDQVYAAKSRITRKLRTLMRDALGE